VSNWTPSNATILADMAGSTLQEITVGKSAINLDFISNDPKKGCVFRMKTASFVSSVSRASDDYEVEIERTLPKLYQQIENTLDVIEFVGARGLLRFSGGDTFVVEDFDKLWDNTFTIEVRNFDRPIDFLF
jgi:hypothetical protein